MQTITEIRAAGSLTETLRTYWPRATVVAYDGAAFHVEGDPGRHYVTGADERVRLSPEASAWHAGERPAPRYVALRIAQRWSDLGFRPGVAEADVEHRIVLVDVVE